MFKLLVILCLILFANAEDGIRTYGITQDNILKIYIVNDNLFDVTFEYYGVYDNLSPIQTFPIIDIIEANSTKLLTQYTIIGKIYKLTNTYSWSLGNKNAIHDDNYIYRLPYAIGDTHQITQGFHGSFTHTGNSLYAVDFEMEEGTKIYASRDGLIVAIKSNGFKHATNKTFEKDANYITIRHSDGTYSNYAHLATNGIFVKIGQMVKQGEFIGYSGNTGFTNGPHLHFVVFTGKDAFSRNSIAIKFNSINGVINEPTKGLYCTATE